MSRKLYLLDPEVFEMATKLLELADDREQDILIYCTFRSLEQQAKLFRQGRSIAEILRKAQWYIKEGYKELADVLLDVGPQNGRIVTWAGPGESYHNYGLAFDAVPMRAGKAVWETKSKYDKKAWMDYGDLVRDVGLDWAGEWNSSKREYPHAQLTRKSIKELLRYDLRSQLGVRKVHQIEV